MERIGREQKRNAMIRTLGIAVVLVVIIGIAGYLVTYHAPAPTTTTTSRSTTTATVIAKLSSCTTISSPGTYYLSSSISTNLQSGSCIDITSSNVKLIGNGNGVTGSGPFVSTPPYTYGILIGNVNNVTVTGVVVSKFSYDIYLNGSTSSYVTNSSAKNATLSGIYLNKATSDFILDDNSSGTSSNKGGIDLQGGGGSQLKGDIIQNNAYYGVIVNSTRNTFTGDQFINNPVDLVCTGLSGLRQNNNFSGSKCNINNFCSFARCSQTNTQYNLSSQLLGPSVTGCGTINSPGSYVLSGSINVADYVNSSFLPPSQAVCINILSPNVRLSCNGHSISNSGYAVYASSSVGLYNLTVAGCSFINDTYAISINHAFQTNLTSITATGGKWGIYLDNVTTGSITNVSTTGETYGITLNATSGIRLSGVTAKQNTYGTYVLNGGPNIYSGDTFTNNTKQDLYCSISVHNSSTQTFSGNSCGITGCAWAKSCRVYVPPAAGSYGLDSCSTISKPGNYTLLGSLVAATGTCINIASPNVNLNCNNHIMIGSAGFTGISSRGMANVTLSNCYIQSFGTGVSFSNGNGIRLNNLHINNTATPVMLANSSFDSVANLNVTYSTQTGLIFYRIRNSSILNNTVASSFGSGTGFFFNGSINDVIVNNTANFNAGYGFSFNSSRSNLVSNNIASANQKADFACSPDSSGLYAENGGINTGVQKIGCLWLVAIPKETLNSICSGVFSTSQITFTQDMLYTYGNKCYTIYNNNVGTGSGTIVNCRGHTIYATHGGTFVDVINSTNVEIENCVLKGFTTAILSSAASTRIINNTIGSANASLVLQGTMNPVAVNNTFENSSYGAILQNTQSAKVAGNHFINANVSIYGVGDSQSIITNNTAASDKIGLYLVNSNGDSVGYNNFLSSSTAGVECAQSAANSSSSNLMRDLGSNVCSSNIACSWMTMSGQCKV